MKKCFVCLRPIPDGPFTLCDRCHERAKRVLGLTAHLAVGNPAPRVDPEDAVAVHDEQQRVFGEWVDTLAGSDY